MSKHFLAVAHIGVEIILFVELLTINNDILNLIIEEVFYLR